MNVASLQLEGLMMAVASLNNLLVHKGLLSVDDVDLALRKAEAGITGHERVHEDMSPANRDAICFPIRPLLLANKAQSEARSRLSPNWQGWWAKPSSPTTIRCDMVRIEHGWCFCEAIKAEMTGEPFWVCFDHDDDCRRAIGSPLTIWIGYQSGQFQLLRGLPKTFSKTRGVTRSFCGDCGTSIGYSDQGLPDELYISIGFMAAPERFPPQAQAYWKMRLPFVEMSDGLPRIDGYSRQRTGLGSPKDRRRF